jgi:hypothetical protein
MISTKLPFLAATLLTASTALAQTAAPTSGTLTYETLRRLDPSTMRININGQEVRPGGTLPNGATFNPPETIEGEEIFLFANGWAKREPIVRGGGRMMIESRGPAGGRPMGGPPPAGPDGRDPGGPPDMTRVRNFRPPMQDTPYIDLATGKTTTITEVTVDSTRKEYYRTEPIAARPTDWEVSSKTKKLLGYICQKATCTVKGQPCTVWFTTELPYTFSPAPQFTPDKGVVLWIESDDLMYRATKLNAGPVDTSKLTPDASAKTVSADELKEIRQKAMATFRQRAGVQFRGRD